jgi:L-threonylcarbamoyladenylate synthase
LQLLRAAAESLAPSDATTVREALRRGELLIYPTDTLYGLGGLVLDPAAARRVRAAKGREAAKPLPVVAADMEQVLRLAPTLPDGALALAGRFWPGPLTLVLAAGVAVPEEVAAGTATVAVRVPGRALTRLLCGLAGPLISTSANQAGGPAPLTCAEAIDAVGGGAAVAVDAGPGSAQPSTIVDATGKVPRLVRAGAVPWDEIARVWS